MATIEKWLNYRLWNSFSFLLISPLEEDVGLPDGLSHHRPPGLDGLASNAPLLLTLDYSVDSSPPAAAPLAPWNPPDLQNSSKEELQLLTLATSWHQLARGICRFRLNCHFYLRLPSVLNPELLMSWHDQYGGSKEVQSVFTNHLPRFCSTSMQFSRKLTNFQKIGEIVKFHQFSCLNKSKLLGNGSTYSRSVFCTWSSLLWAIRWYMLYTKSCGTLATYLGELIFGPP